MFDPDHFYQVFYENFIDDGSVMYVPRQHGEKQLSEFKLYGAEHVGLQSLLAIGRHRKTFMYDQEPWLDWSATGLKDRFSSFLNFSLHHYLDKMDAVEMVIAIYANIMFPIWCHSEENSADIARFAKTGFAPCYYWYHAFIARDWFRYWQFNKSLAVKDKSDSSYRFLLYSRDHTGTRQYRKDIIDQLRPLARQISYDWAGTKKVGPEYSAKIDVTDAQNSSIHLVAETLFNTNKIYLTEKMFKPIVMSQPFLVFAAPGALTYLRRYGFRTFDHVWDESYDQITDHDLRLKTVCNMVLRLSELPHNEFQSLYRKCLPVIDHNRQHFFNHKFINQCWNELTYNWAAAVVQADENQKQRPWGPSIDLIGQNPLFLNIPHFSHLAKNMLELISDPARQLAIKNYPMLSAL